MSLSQIATDLRADVLRSPGEEFSHALTHGASVHLRAEIISDINEDNTAEIEFHFKVERTGKMPDEGKKEYTAWLAELRTFRDPKFFNVPEKVEAKMLRGNRKYAATFVWTETLEIQLPKKPVKREGEIVMRPLPASDVELTAWARELGQGVHVSGVNVATGEM